MQVLKNIPPSDFLHGLLCLHSYQNSQPSGPIEFPPQQQLHSNNQYLTKWKIKNVFQFDEFEPFYAVLYENKEDCQFVFAFRGLQLKHLSLFNSSNQFKSDFCEKIQMLIKNPHEMDVYVKCKEVLTIAYENGYYLSFTGYNLGAFMAQLCLTYCHKQASTDTFLSKAVLFDPIGVAKGIRQLTKRTDNDDFGFNETVGATVTYLSFHCA